jgi:uncharacterized protein YPO0396
MKEVMLAKMETNQKRMDARIEANNKKLEVLQSTLVSRMHIHQARSEPTQEEMKANLDFNHETLMTIETASKEMIEAMMEACFEKTEACLESKEPTSLELVRGRASGSP